MPNLRLHAAALSTLVALAGCSAAGSNAIPSLARPSERASRAYAPASNSTSHLYALSGLEPALFADQGVPPTIDDPTISVYTASQPEELVRTIGDDVFGPSAMAYGSDGTLYVAFLASNLTGAQGGAIEVFKPGATTPERVIAGSSTGISAPQAIAVGAGHIYVGNSYDGNLPVSQAPNLGSVEVFDENASGNAKPLYTLAGNNTLIQVPQGLLVDADADVYVLTQNSSSIGGVLLEFQGNQRGNVAPAYKGSATGGVEPPVNYAAAKALAWYGSDVAVLASSGSLSPYGCGTLPAEVFVFGAGTGIAQPPVNCFPAGASGRAFSPCGTGFWVGTSARNTKTGSIAGVLDEYGTNGAKDVSIAGSATGIDVVDAIACYGGAPTIANLTTGTIETFKSPATGNHAPSSAVNTNPAGLYAPVGIAVLPNGAVAVADAGTPYGAISPRITVFAPGATGQTKPQRTITSSAFFKWTTQCGIPMQAIAADSSSSLYVAQVVPSTCSGAKSLGSVTLFTSKQSGNSTPARTLALPAKTIGSATVAAVGYGIAVDSKKQLWVSGNDLIDVFAAGGNAPIRSIKTSSEGLLSSSAVDGSGNVGYAGGTSGNSAATVTPKGVQRTIAGSNTKLESPVMAAFLPNGSLAVVNGYTAAGTSVATEILTFASGANGNVAPAGTLPIESRVLSIAVGP